MERLKDFYNKSFSSTFLSISRSIDKNSFKFVNRESTVPLNMITARICSSREMTTENKMNTCRKRHLCKEGSCLISFSTPFRFQIKGN